MEPDGLYLRILKELASVAEIPHSTTFWKAMRLWEIPSDQKKGKYHTQFQEQGGRSRQLDQLQLSQPNLSPWEDYRANPPGRHLPAEEHKKMTGNSQHGFTKDNWCLVNTRAHCKETTGSAMMEEHWTHKASNNSPPQYPYSQTGETGLGEVSSEVFGNLPGLLSWKNSHQLCQVPSKQLQSHPLGISTETSSTTQCLY